jgi:phospholipid/cholesterol/gamma-HCH transport system permease protein
MPATPPHIAPPVSANAPVRLQGQWTAAQLAQPGVLVVAQVDLARVTAGQAWDLREAVQLDHVGAQLLWNHWGQQWPSAVDATVAQRAMLERVARFTVPLPPPSPISWTDKVQGLGSASCA